MKLFELHRGELFTLVGPPKLPPRIPSVEFDPEKVYMCAGYGDTRRYCYVEDIEGNDFYFSYDTEVKPLNVTIE